MEKNITEAEVIFNDRNNYGLTCLEKWSKTPYLDGISKKCEKVCVSMILEMQEYAQQLICFNNSKFSENTSSIINKVFRGGFLPPQIISMQPMRGAGDNINFLRFRYKPSSEDGYVEQHDETAESPEVKLVIESEQCAAKTRIFKIDSLSAETFEKENWVDNVAEQIGNDITNEILTDLRKNVGTKVNWDYNQFDDLKQRCNSLYEKYKEVSGIIHRKTLRSGATWMIANEELASMLVENYCPRKVSKLTYLGMINAQCRVWAHPDQPKDEILLGYKGDSYIESGYFYNPYVFMTTTPKNDKEIGLLLRYSKKLLREGSKFYATIKVDNMPKDADGE